MPERMLLIKVPVVDRSTVCCWKSVSKIQSSQRTPALVPLGLLVLVIQLGRAHSLINDPELRQSVCVLNREDKDALPKQHTHVVKTLFRIKHSHITCSVFNLFYIPQEMWHSSARVRFIVIGIIKIITNINISLQSVEVIVVLFSLTSFTG